VLLHVFRESKENVNNNIVSQGAGILKDFVRKKKKRGGFQMFITKHSRNACHQGFITYAQKIFLSPPIARFISFKQLRRSAVICNMQEMVRQHFLFGVE
jgi:hypothetical protein